MPIQKLRKFLDGHNVKYTVISHSTAYTAQEVAESSHLSGKEIAKTVIVKLDGKLTMVVVPGPNHVDFELLKEYTDSDHVDLAVEDEFAGLFPDCEIGAMPPFGELYDMRLIIAKRLADDKEIAFNAGNHRELIKMSFDDYKKLAEPEILDLTFYTRDTQEV